MQSSINRFNHKKRMFICKIIIVNQREQVQYKSNSLQSEFQVEFFTAEGKEKGVRNLFMSAN